MRASNDIFCEVQSTVICRGVQVDAFLLLTRPGLPWDQNTQKTIIDIDKQIQTRQFNIGKFYYYLFH